MFYPSEIPWHDFYKGCVIQIIITMKTRIISVIAILFTTSQAFSQSKNVGFYIGPNFSNITITSPELTAKNHSGFQAGTYYRKGGFVYGQMGLEYLRLQTDFTANDSLSGKVSLNRLQLPLYGGLNLLNFSKKIVNVRGYAGPVITYTISAPSFNPDFSLTDFSRFGINGTVGAGVDVLIFSLDAGYTFGLNNLFSSNFNGKADYAFINAGIKF